MTTTDPKGRQKGDVLVARRGSSLVTPGAEYRVEDLRPDTWRGIGSQWQYLVQRVRVPLSGPRFPLEEVGKPKWVPADHFLTN